MEPNTALGSSPQRTVRGRVDLMPYWFMLPSLVAIAGVLLYPMAQAMVMSFQTVNLLRPEIGTPFIGLENFLQMLAQRSFWESLRVTIAYSALAVVGAFVIGLYMAVLLNTAFTGRGFARALSIAPWAMPPVVTSIVWMWMYDPQFGVINYLLSAVGISKGATAWLSDPFLALPSVVLVAVWKHVPLATITLLAGLQAIPADQYESASIDGANPFQEFLHVTLPGLKPVSGLLVLLLFLWTFKEFTYIYVLTGGGPGRATETLVIQVYYQAFQFLNFGYASAIGVVILVICVVLSVIYLKLLYGQEGR